MKDELPKSLDELLAELPQALSPARDLWPGIAAQVSAKPRARPMVFAAAAAITASCVASALTWAVLHDRPSTNPPGSATLAAMFDEPRDPHYLDARASLETTFRERLNLLEPATRAQIESSLAVIQRAHADIKKALAKDPASPVLEQLWQSTWHDELDLYDHVVRATQPTMTRT